MQSRDTETQDILRRIHETAGKLVKTMLDKHDIEVHYVATAANRANGQAERYVATVLTSSE